MPSLALSAALVASALVTALPATAAPATAVPAATAPRVTPMSTNISEAQVLQAQRAWCDALLSISRAYRTGGLPLARATAGKVLDSAYGYA
jgi:hypothetical protein